MLPLFDTPPSFDRAALAQRLRQLSAEQLWIGTSSWKYEGWLDQIYTRSRYMTRGKFSQARFEQECLAEFAEIFPIVCGDFSFYQFPTPEFWQKLFASAPSQLKFALKVPEEVTVENFPRHARYGARAGTANEAFLRADIFQAMFLDLLEPYRDRIAALIFEFGARSTIPSVFVSRLAAFLEELPSTFRYAIEIRNREFLTPDYLLCLADYNAAHVLNSWTKMPSLKEQLQIPGVITADFTVVRALLRPGRPYEQAVEKFQPYDTIKEADPDGREALRAVMKCMREERKTGYIFVNNRFEGNAPETIRSVVEE